MMIRVTVEAADIETLKTKLLELYQGFAVAYPASIPTTPELPVEAKEPKRRARKTPAPAESVIEEVPTDVQPAPVASEEVNLKEAVFAALKKVNTNKGVLVAKNILQQFSCARISELQEKDYPEFIKACEALI